LVVVPFFAPFYLTFSPRADPLRWSPFKFARANRDGATLGARGAAGTFILAFRSSGRNWVQAPPYIPHKEPSQGKSIACICTLVLLGPLSFYLKTMLEEKEMKVFATSDRLYFRSKQVAEYIRQIYKDTLLFVSPPRHPWDNDLWLLNMSKSPCLPRELDGPKSLAINYFCFNVDVFESF
jgi:hypothetical protein